MKDPVNPHSISLPPWPIVDHALFGPTERVALPRYTQLASGHLIRNAMYVPHVTHFDESDVSGFETARASLAAGIDGGPKVPLIAFIVAAVARALEAHPMINASLDESGRGLILKKYVHIGVAVDTPRGLLVPVIRNADQKPPTALAAEIASLAERARGKGLPLDEMSGGCITVSSLGSVGGMGFTPIINYPELAIVGVSRTVRRPFESASGGIEWRTMVPFSLSYDHRAINGSEAGRFCATLASALTGLLEQTGG